MNILKRKIWLVAALMMLATSCGTVEEYVLLNDLDVDTYYKMQPMQELHIKRGDRLRIVVTHKLPMLAEMFNNKINSVEGGESLTEYFVNEGGYINFPLLDTVKVEGLTCSEAEQLLTKKIADAGLAYGATVSVKITNFKVTVIGESATGIYEFEDGKATIFDLVAKANLANGGGGGGGISIRRDKILVMREVNGVLNSDYSVTISGPDGALIAQGFHLTDKGNLIDFKGKTDSKIKQKGIWLYIKTEDGLHLDRIKQTLIGKKNVQIRHQENTLTADSVTLYYTNEKDNRVKQIYASGQVVLDNGRNKITGNEGRYNPLTEEMEMIGNVRLYQGKSFVTADKAILNMNTGESHLQNNSDSARIKGSLLPSDLKKRDEK